MYKIKVFDEGWVTMCEWDNEKKDFIYPTYETKEEAQAEADRYKEFFGRSAVVVEA